MIIVSHSYTDHTYTLGLALTGLHPSYRMFVLVHTLLDNLSWQNMGWRHNSLALQVSDLHISQ